MPIKVKKEHLKTVVGFNNSGAPLGDRKDLHLLLNDVIDDDNSLRNEHIADMFEELPTKAEIKDLIDNDLAQRAESIKVSRKEQKPAANGKK